MATDTVAQVGGTTGESGLTRRVERLEDAVTGIKVTLGRMEERLGHCATQDDIHVLSSRIDQVETNLFSRQDKSETGLSGRLEKVETGLSGRLDKTDARVGKIEGDIAGIKTELAVIKADVAVIKVTMATREDLLRSSNRTAMWIVGVLVGIVIMTIIGGTLMVISRLPSPGVPVLAPAPAARVAP